MNVADKEIMYFDILERIGRRLGVKYHRLPIRTNGTLSIEYAKQQYESMGIKVVGKHDDLFYSVELPSGWKIKPTNHSMWSELFDDSGKKRARFFYKANFYDREAFINFEQ